MLPALKEALESCAGSFEVMKEIVAAVSDAERGRSTSVASLLANVQSRQGSRLAEQTLQVRRVAPALCSQLPSWRCRGAGELTTQLTALEKDQPSQKRCAGHRVC